MKRAFLLLFSAGLVLAGCGPSGLFIPTIEATEPVVDTIRSGTVLEPGTEFQVRTDAADTGATDVVLQILDENGDLQAELAYPLTDLSSEERFLVPELATGRYELLIQLFSGPDLLSEESRTFFVGSTGTAPQRFSLFPASPSVGAEMIVRSSADDEVGGNLESTLESPDSPLVPSSSAAWYQWYLDGELVHASGSLDDWTLQAPASPGVYALELDLYPVAPESGEHWPFRSSISSLSDVPVGESDDLDDTVMDSDRYLVRHELRGEFSDRGAWEDLFGPAPALLREGNTRLSLVQGLLGYSIAPDAGLSRDIYPLPSDSDALLPFTLEFSLVVQTSGTLLSVESTEAANLVLSVADSEQLLLNLGDGPQLTGPRIPIGEPVSVAVSYRPESGGSSASVEWFVNGALAGSHSVSPLLRDGQTVSAQPTWQVVQGRYRMGGVSDSAAAVVDAMRVFFRAGGSPSANPDLFREAMFRYYRDALVWASGFEDDSILSELDIRGPVRVRRGMLEIDRGGEALFPDWDFSTEDLVVDLDTAAVPLDSMVSFVLRDDTGRNLTLFGDGSIAGPSGVVGELGYLADSTLRVRISHREGSLVFALSSTADPGTDDQVQPEPDAFELSVPMDSDFAGIALVLAGSRPDRQDAEERIMRIDSVTAVRRDEGLAGRLLGSAAGD